MTLRLRGFYQSQATHARIAYVFFLSSFIEDKGHCSLANRYKMFLQWRLKYWMKIDKDPWIAIVKMIKAVSIKTRLISIHFIRTILNKGEERETQDKFWRLKWPSFFSLSRNNNTSAEMSNEAAEFSRVLFLDESIPSFFNIDFLVRINILRPKEINILGWHKHWEF